MATERQIAANKLNSQKSTGPATEAGKAKSCLNRLSHGFASSTANLIRGENPEDLKALLADLMDEYRPGTPTEQILVEKMCQHQWLSGRAFRLQSEAVSSSLYSNRLTLSKDFGLLIRYHAAAERNFHKAHAELVKAQKERKKSEIGFEPQHAPQDLGAAAGPAPAQPPTQSKVEPKTIPLTRVEPDFPASVVPDAQPDTETTPEVLKKAA